MFGKLLYYRNLENTGSVAQLVEQRPFKPESHLAPLPKNSVFPIVNKDFVTSTEDQTKVKSTCLARTFGARLVTLLIRPTIKQTEYHLPGLYIAARHNKPGPVSLFRKVVTRIFPFGFLMDEINIVAPGRYCQCEVDPHDSPGSFIKFGV